MNKRQWYHKVAWVWWEVSGWFGNIGNWFARGMKRAPIPDNSKRNNYETSMFVIATQQEMDELTEKITDLLCGCSEHVWMHPRAHPGPYRDVVVGWSLVREEEGE